MPKVTQPSTRALHNSTTPIPTQRAAVLMGRVLAVGPSRDDRLNAPAGQTLPQGIAAIPPIGNQPLGPLARSPRLSWPSNGNGVEGLFEARDFRRGRRVQVCSQRSTRAIDQNHPLRTLAAPRCADFGSPLFAGMKLPSAKHSSQRSFWRSLSWAKKARQSLSSTPVSSQCLRHRQQVLGLPYRRGNSLHWAPVQRIHRMPSKHRRSSTRGRPPREDAFACGRWTRMMSHCALLNLRHAMPHLPCSLASHGIDMTSAVTCWLPLLFPLLYRGSLRHRQRRSQSATTVDPADLRGWGTT
jgi:hypothetical protein